MNIGVCMGRPEGGREGGAPRAGRVRALPPSTTTTRRGCATRPRWASSRDIRSCPRRMAHLVITTPRALYVGEAARMTHNATGEGISQAMQSGVYAAEAVSDVIAGRTTERRGVARLRCAPTGGASRRAFSQATRYGRSSAPRSWTESPLCTTSRPSGGPWSACSGPRSRAPRCVMPPSSRGPGSRHLHDAKEGPQSLDRRGQRATTTCRSRAASSGPTHEPAISPSRARTRRETTSRARSSPERMRIESFSMRAASLAE